MKKFVLKLKIDRKIIIHKIFQFTEKEKNIFLNQIISEYKKHSQLIGELEYLIVKNLGIKYWVKEYGRSDKNAKEDHSLYGKSIEYLVEKYPDLIIAAEIQNRCYDIFNGFSSNSIKYFQGVEKQETIVDHTENYSFVCLIEE